MDEIVRTCQAYLAAEISDADFLLALSHLVEAFDLHVEVATAILNMFEEVGQ